MPAPTLGELSVAIARLEEQAEHSNDDRKEIKNRLDLVIDILNKVAGVADQVAQIRETAHERNNVIQRDIGQLDEQIRLANNKYDYIESSITKIKEDIRKLQDTGLVDDTRKKVNYWWIGLGGTAIIIMSGFLQAVLSPWIVRHFFWM